MAIDRQHEIIEIDKMEDLADSYFVKRGIIYSRDCDNNRLNVWIEGTLFENLEIFYHCENEIVSTPDMAFDLFEVGRKVLVLHKFIYNDEGIEKIERTVIGLKYNPPEGISNIQPCIVKRFFAKIKKVVGESILYSYYWIYIDDEENIITIEIKNNEDKTETEVFYEIGFSSELEKALYLGDPSLNPLAQSATKSFMMTNDKGFRERWVATPYSLFKDQCEVINIMPQRWVIPPPCDAGLCPPNRFYCNIEKRILVWYGAYEKFIGATIIRFDTDTTYTWNCVAETGASIDGDEGYLTFTDTEWDIPLNMISGLNWVSDTEISFYLPFGTNRRPGQVTIDWINYDWYAPPVNTSVTDYAGHWYWTEDGFEKKDLANLNQQILDETMEDEYEYYSWPGTRDCDNCDCEECIANDKIIQYQGKYVKTVNNYAGYLSNYQINIFDEIFIADTKKRNLDVEEQKFYNAGKCKWVGGSVGCKSCGVGVYKCGRRDIDEQLYQKVANGLSAFWNANNVAYFYEEKNRNKCWACAEQNGTLRRVCGDTTVYTYWGGPNQEDFGNCKWLDTGGCLSFSECPGGLGKCFELSMPGNDWFATDEDYVEFLGSGTQGDHYKWIKKTDINDYETPFVRKYKIDGEIEFDATKIYKTYYLDDRATCHEQGLVIAGKGVKDDKIFWEVYHDGTDITKKLFEALGCKQSELDEIGLI